MTGLAYGIVLFLFALICAGGGHGSYLPFAIFGAPLSLIHPAAGLFAAPFLWGVSGLLLAKPTWRGWAAVLLLVHWSGVAAVLLLGNSFESLEQQWEYFKKARDYVPAALWGGFAVYLLGQVVAWARVSQSKAAQAP